MRETVEDLRILRLAQLYEEAYERFVREVARTLDHDLQHRLAALEAPLDTHAERLRREAERLQRALEAGDAPRLVAAALADVVAVEREAREFYFENADRVHDAALADLFHQLAHEEARHMEIAQDALDAYRERAGLAHDAAPPPNHDMPVLWEGSGDLEAPRRR